jgi:hypothetical protein
MIIQVAWNTITLELGFLPVMLYISLHESVIYADLSPNSLGNEIFSGDRPCRTQMMEAETICEMLETLACRLERCQQPDCRLSF